MKKKLADGERSRIDRSICFRVENANGSYIILRHNDSPLLLLLRIYVLYCSWWDTYVRHVDHQKQGHNQKRDRTKKYKAGCTRSGDQAAPIRQEKGELSLLARNPKLLLILMTMMHVGKLPVVLETELNNMLMMTTKTRMMAKKRQMCVMGYDDDL